MDTQKLRQRILDLAIRGKLVPQDPDDEPASVLLDRIRAEKERLIAEGKIKRPKARKSTDKSHYQQFTPPFDIPDSWVWVRLEEIIRVKSGENLNVRELQSKDIYPVYGGNRINGYYNKCNVAKDTIIIGRVGFYCGSIHKTNSESWVTDNALIVDTDIVNIDINWLCLVLIWANLRKTSNSTAQPVVSGKSIYPVWVPLPSKDEQSRIVDTFDTFIKTIETIEIGKTSVQKLISLTKTKILDLAMQGKLVPQDPADEPAADMLRRINPKAKIITDNPHSWNIPNSWTWCQLGDIFHHNTGKALSSSNRDGIEYEYITTSNVYWNRFELDDLKKMPFKENELEKCTVRHGDLLVCEGGDVGRSAIWNLDRNIMIQNHLHRLRPIANEIHTSLYYHVFRLYKYKDLIGGKGIALQGFSSKSLHQLVIPLPPANEQKRIVAKIEELYSLLDEIEASLQS